MAGKDTNIGAKRARQTREALELDPAAPLACLLTLVTGQLGLPVVIAALPEGVAGCCWRDGDRVLLWVNGTDPAARQRFTLAHELGHLRCRHDGAIPVETFVTLGGKTTDGREVQANAFAAELLAPAAGVREMVGDGQPALDDVVRVAARFGISTIAALFRLNTLGLATRYDDLLAEIQAGEHNGIWAREGLAETADGLADIISGAELPWLAPVLRSSALDAVVRRLASTETAAASAGCDPDALAGGAEAIGV